MISALLWVLETGGQDYYRNRTALPPLKGEIGAVVLSFNHRQNIEAIASALQNEPGIGSVIVAEDGSWDGSKEMWRETLRPQDKIFHTKDVHEIRAYNNAGFQAPTNVSVLCFLQDDDIPEDRGWAREVLNLFDAFRSERLAILSGLAAELCQVEVGEQQVEHPSAMKNSKVTHPIPFLYNEMPFMFTTEAWLAPMCVRRDVFLELRGFDETLTRPGQPGIGLDIHLSLRAAIHGFTIGVHGAEFQRGIGGHGTVSDPVKTQLRLDMRQNISRRIRQIAGCRWPPSMLRHVNDLNAKYLAPRPGSLPLRDDLHAKCKTFTSRPCRSSDGASPPPRRMAPPPR